MSKLGCSCGHIIADQTDYLAFKADCIPDKSVFLLYDEVIENISSFIQAIRDNKREEWIETFFGLEYASLNLADAAIINDCFSKAYSAKNRIVYQCENCGRIHIQQQGTNRFFSFLPESDEARNVFDA